MGKQFLYKISGYKTDTSAYKWPIYMNFKAFFSLCDGNRLIDSHKNGFNFYILSSET